MDYFFKNLRKSKNICLRLRQSMLQDSFPTDENFIINNCDFQDVDLTGLSLSNIHFVDCDFRFAAISGAVFSELTKCDLSEIVADRVSFGALSDCCVKQTELSNCEFSGWMSRSDFSKSKIQYCRMTTIGVENRRDNEISTANRFDYTDIVAMDAVFAPLSECSFARARISESRFSRAALDKTDFDGARVSATSFLAAHWDGSRIRSGSWINCVFDENFPCEQLNVRNSDHNQIYSYYNIEVMNKLAEEILTFKKFRAKLEFRLSSSRTETVFVIKELQKVFVLAQIDGRWIRQYYCPDPKQLLERLMDVAMDYAIWSLSLSDISMSGSKRHQEEHFKNVLLQVFTVWRSRGL